jgi:stage III sporulation protein AA
MDVLRHWYDYDAKINVSKVIITDEIGNSGDMEAVMQVINAGTRIIASAHGYNISELKTGKRFWG